MSGFGLAAHDCPACRRKPFSLFVLARPLGLRPSRSYLLLRPAQRPTARARGARPAAGQASWRTRRRVSSPLSLCLDLSPRTDNLIDGFEAGENPRILEMSLSADISWKSIRVAVALPLLGDRGMPRAGKFFSVAAEQSVSRRWSEEWQILRAEIPLRSDKRLGNGFGRTSRLRGRFTQLHAVSDTSSPGRPFQNSIIKTPAYMLSQWTSDSTQRCWIRADIIE